MPRSISFYTRAFNGTDLDTAAVSDEPGGYLKPREVIDADEDKLIEAMMKSTHKEYAVIPEGAGKDPSFYEAHHGHTSALLQGSLNIDNTEGLPVDLRVGLFASNGEYKAMCRPHVIDLPDLIKTYRFSMKLDWPEMVPNMYAKSGKANELDLLFAKGDPANPKEHTFFFNNARQMALGSALNPASSTMTKLSTMFNPLNMGAIKGALSIVNGIKNDGVGDTESGLFGSHYYALGPYKCGPGVVKYALKPLQEQKVALGKDHDEHAAINKTSVEDYLASGKDVSFEFLVQVGTTACIPEPKAGEPAKDVVAAEFCDAVWDEKVSPFIRVGTLTIPAGAKNLSADFEGKATPLQLNSWNTYEENRPLGQCFRVRKEVHRQTSNARNQRFYGRQPGQYTGKCPFA